MNTRFKKRHNVNLLSEQTASETTGILESLGDGNGNSLCWELSDTHLQDFIQPNNTTAYYKIRMWPNIIKLWFWMFYL